MLYYIWNKIDKKFQNIKIILILQRTVRQLISIFKTPEEINLTNLQQTAFAKFKQYREATALTLQVLSCFNPDAKTNKHFEFIYWPIINILRFYFYVSFSSVRHRHPSLGGRRYPPNVLLHHFAARGHFHGVLCLRHRQPRQHIG